MKKRKAGFRGSAQCCGVTGAPMETCSLNPEVSGLSLLTQRLKY